MTTKRITLFFLSCMLTVVYATAAYITPITSGIPAFPGAEGYGKYTTGGRGGTVFYVTRNDDCSDSKLVPGTLRWALYSDNGGKPRTILFNTCGTIYLTSKLRTNKDNVTIEGQTAPGGGICLAGYNLYINSNNVIVRHIRFRAGDIPSKSMCGVDMENGANVILDHCSITWSMEECLTAYDTKYTTVQHCIIGESLYNSKNSKGARAYATQWGGEHSTMHHCLITNSNSRSPRFNGARGTNDRYVDSEFANNVVFNWGNSGAQYGGENDKSKTQVNDSYDRVYLINNFYRPGPATKSATSGSRYFCSPSSPYGEWYMTGNKFEVDGAYSSKSGVWSKDNLDAVNADNYYGAQSGNSARAIKLTGNDFLTYVLQSIPYDLSGMTYETADEAYQKVVRDAGATLPRLDEVDARLLAQAAGTADDFASGDRGSKLGIIDSPDNITLKEHDTYYAVTDSKVGSVYYNYPFLGMREGDKFAKDTDGDGLPDSYETKVGLNPEDASDGAEITESGYSNLEVYLNGVADGIINKTEFETETYSVVIAPNMSQYKEGYTMAAWLNSADGKVYVPGLTYNTPSQIVYDTPVFNANTKKITDRNENIVVKWDFSQEGAPSVTGEGIFVTQADVEGEKQDVKLDFNNSVITISWYDKARLKVNGVAVSPAIEGDKASFSVDASSLNSIVLNIPKVVPLYTEKAIINTAFHDWRYVGSNDTIHINTDFSDETIIFSTYNTTVDSAATNPGKFDPATNPDYKGYVLAAKSASTFTTSKFKNITKVRFFQGVTGNDRGFGLRKKGAKDGDWVTLYNTRVSGTPQWIEVNVNDEDVELQWWNLNEEQNAYMFHLEVYAMVENTSTQVTLTTGVNPADAGTIVREPNSETYDINSEVTVTAKAANGFLFKSWTDDMGNILSTEHSYKVTMSDDLTLIANFSDGSEIFTDGPYKAIVHNGDELLFALKAATSASDERFRIFLHNGKYDLETAAKTRVAKNVSLIGESKDGVLIVNYAPSDGNADKTPTLFIDQTDTDVYMQDLTIRQGYDFEKKTITKQAIALRARGDRHILKNVALQGCQDTYYLNKSDRRGYFEDCDIYGDVDFIYGDGTAYFNKCTLHYNNFKGGGYLTAPNTATANKWGMVFNDCVVTASEDAAKKYNLGRPWGDSPAATFINTTFEVLPTDAGWAAMTGGLVCRFHEYGSKDKDGKTLDLSLRSIQACNPAQGSDPCVIDAQTAATYTIGNVLAGNDSWNPCDVTVQMSAPTNVVLTGNTISWDAVSNALCYAIVKDNSVVAFTTELSYELNEPGTYAVRVANQMGGLGASSSVVSDIENVLAPTMVNGCSNAVYNLQGQKVNMNNGFKGIVIMNGKKFLMK
ncbi:MAG: hypothetical protein KBS65_05105 [Prevotella sp.]|nr:hypothetical protein [Candidatus Equicola stercoris]